MTAKTTENKDNEEWFKKLENELNKKTEEILKTINVESGKKKDINATLIQDLWKVYLKFGDINIHFNLEPPYTQWATFTDFPNVWKLKDDFNFGTVEVITFTDTTREQGRTGDSLKIMYYNPGDGERIKILFEFCEGEKYYKYSGWKRVFTQYVLYDKPVSSASMDDIHDIMFNLITKWYESHLKKDRGLIIDYVQKNFEKGESFSE
ncbi:MAG: hypothetical protein ACP5SF_01055 [Thermoplasmata archaeon]